MEQRPAPNFADRIISAIVEKLEANRTVIARSPFGRITWRKRNKEIEVDLEPKL